MSELLDILAILPLDAATFCLTLMIWSNQRVQQGQIDEIEKRLTRGGL